MRPVPLLRPRADPGVLALMRIYAGLTLMIWSVSALSWWAGVDFPADVPVAPASENRFSGSDAFRRIFGYLALLTVFFFSLRLAYGVKSRRSAFFCWLGLRLVHPVAFPLGDAVLLWASLVFWLAFLPAGDFLSFDAGLSSVENETETKPNDRLADLALIGFLSEGFAFYSSDFVSRLDFVPHASLTFCFLSVALTVAWVGSSFVSKARPVLFLLLASWSFFGGLEDGWRAWVSFGFFAPVLLDAPLSRRFSQGNEATRRSLVFYDLDCGFCKKTAYALVALLGLPKRIVVERQDGNEDTIRERARRVMEEQKSWVVWNGKTHLTGFEALIHLVSLSPVFGWKAPLMKPSFVRKLGEKAYRRIADGRAALSRWTRSLRFVKRREKLPVLCAPVVLAGLLDALFGCLAETASLLPFPSEFLSLFATATP